MRATAAGRTLWALLAAGAVLAGCGEPSSSPVLATASPTPAVPSPATRAPTPSPTATPVPTAAPYAELVARFGRPFGWERVAAVAHGSAGYLAIGDRRYPANEVGWSTIADVAWVSTDGRHWDEVALPPELDGSVPVGVVAASDGDFVVFANGQEFGASASVVVRTPDGRGDWSVVESGLGDDVSIGKVVHGPKGYLLLQYRALGGPDGAVWYSTDGLHWERTREFPQTEMWVNVNDIGAGRDGFVALGARYEPSGDRWERFVVASGDGRTWIERRHPFGQDPPDYRPDAFLGPLGGDWVAILPSHDDGVRIWSSVDGLSWEETARIPDQGTRLAWAPAIFGDAGRVYFSTSANDGPAPYDPVQLWTSGGGGTWEQLDFGEGAVPICMASLPDGTLFAGMSLADGDGAASFWVAGAP